MLVASLPEMLAYSLFSASDGYVFYLDTLFINNGKEREVALVLSLALEKAQLVVCLAFKGGGGRKRSICV